MDFIYYAVSYIADAAAGFGMLFAVSAAMVHWRDRRVRRDRAYWNTPT